MLRVALNGRFSGTRQPTGTQTAAFQLFDAIVRSERAVELVIFADPRFAGISDWKNFPKTTVIELPFQDWPRWRAQLWEQLVLPTLCRQSKCSLCHHPITTSPLWSRKIKAVVTLHDLNFYLHPEWYTAQFRWVYKVCALPGLQSAERVVTISHYVAGQAERWLKIPASRLRMVYNGVKPLAQGRTVGGGPLRLLCVGSLQPHKNLVRMIQAFLQVRAQIPELELQIAGRPQPRFKANAQLPELLEAPGVTLLGYLSEEELATAYAETALFCYPSLEEGFGLPILEAMAAGALVLTSNRTCLPEIAGGAAILVDPTSVEAIAAGILEGLRLTPIERKRRIAEGRERASQFSWNSAAIRYLEIYQELAL